VAHSYEDYQQSGGVPRTQSTTESRPLGKTTAWYARPSRSVAEYTTGRYSSCSAKPTNLLHQLRGPFGTAEVCRYHSRVSIGGAAVALSRRHGMEALKC